MNPGRKNQCSNYLVFQHSFQIFKLFGKKETQLGPFDCSATGSASPPLHLCFLVFTPGFVGESGVRKGERKNDLKCDSPRQI